jgi:hypothetical protein
MGGAKWLGSSESDMWLIIQKASSSCIAIISRQEPYLRKYETHTLEEAGALFKDI